jgi:hypothetical protein
MKILVCSPIRVGIHGKNGYDLQINDDCSIQTIELLCEKAKAGDEIWKIEGHWLDGKETKVDFINDSYSAEDVLLLVFNILTPHNAALSRILCYWFDQVSLGKMERSLLDSKFDKLIEISRDVDQIKTLKDLKSQLDFILKAS